MTKKCFSGYPPANKREGADDDVSYIDPQRCDGRMKPLLWLGIVVVLVGLFMLVAGIGPLWLPIVVVLAGAAIAVLGKVRPGLLHA